MNQIRSLRIDLQEFEFNSENRRILRKTEWVELESLNIPLEESKYDYNIHKMGKEFYYKKNNEYVFSAAKIKELILDSDKTNFNNLLKFKDSETGLTLGYAISLETENIFHYAFPFYDLSSKRENLGMGMILKSIEYSIEHQKKYFYLGSVYTTKSRYKLQFNNIEWWDQREWSKDIEKLKKILT